ncbi:hypothetical protein CEB3_c14820 [Peptococcaceae bacterium CEB3]|nr:hypothetical protein CEB3_c14820 [Peptococcaceae bacterium CEB3]
MAGEGNILRTARESKGWTLPETEEATKIRVRYLQALEEENYAILPGAAYSKGFLRTYANHLGLDPEEIIGLYKMSAQPQTPPALEGPLTPLKSRPVWFRPAVAGVMALLAIVLVIGISQWTRNPGPSANSGYTPSALPSPPKPQKPAKKTNPPASQGKPSGTAQAGGTVAGGTAPSTTGQGTTSAATTPTSGVTAKLVFTQDVWIEFNVDGQAPVQQYFHAGTTKEITATDKIDLMTVGNAGGLSITVNGKAVPSLGGNGQVVNSIILDKAHYG